MTVICGELGGFRRGKHSAALCHNTNEDVRMAVHGNDIVCLSNDDGLIHNDKTSQVQTNSERHENCNIRRVRRKKPAVVEPCVTGWDRSDWTVLGH